MYIVKSKGKVKKIFILLGVIITMFIFKSCEIAPIRIVSFLTTDTTDKYMQRFVGKEDSKRADYLKKHEKDFEYARFDDAFIMVDVERLGERASIYICSYEEQENDEFIVNEVSLVSDDGEVIYYESDMHLDVKRTTPDKLEEEFLCTYSHNGDWFYVGNQLTLTIEVEFQGKTKIISYPMEVRKRHSLAFPT